AFEGSGIGLALAREMVLLHHGAISVSSEENRETVFTVSLPLGKTHLREDEMARAAEPQQISETLPEPPEEAVAETAQAEDGDAAAADQMLVLVVEDNRDLRHFIRDSLREMPDFQVECAPDGKAGLDMALELIPDLVISDVMMPEMDGYHLCDTLKKDGRTNHIPVILLTAKASGEDKIEGLLTGADDYLTKPFDPRELQIRVRNLIKIRRHMQEKFRAEMLLKPADISVPSVHETFLKRLMEIVEIHLESEDFSVEQFAAEAGMSRGQLHRKVKAITNQSPSEFVRTFRLHRAAELIKQNAGNLAEIAYQVGFNSQAYFTRSFQEQFGCSPREFRKQLPPEPEG
ncbi:MAG TPA: response regulator, partial [Calditrichia bacterium]|nr:response regulator [Calditrichia bacterium]